MSLTTPERVRKLQKALHVKAKEAPDFRFYALYDKVYRMDVLVYAYRCCRANGGAAGADDQTFADIEAYGEERWLDVLADTLRRKTYRPMAIRRVSIPKPDGSQRPLGIPTIRDRVVQTAARLVLEPIFEADLPDEQYAYRPRRSAQEAVKAVHAQVCSGHIEVVDADLSDYFGSIPHTELLKSVARRISDRHMLHLIKMWVRAPVEETDVRGRRRRTTTAKDSGRGTPQGAPVSSLLANLYMRRFIVAWRLLGIEQRLDAHIISYADDFVICCRETGQQAHQAMQKIMCRLKLTVNEAKTSLRTLPHDSVDFLGYTIGRCYDPRTGKAYYGMQPSRKAISRVCREIRVLTHRRWETTTMEERVELINRLLIGWAHYFRLGRIHAAYQAVDVHTRNRLRQWLCRKHKLPGKGITRFPDAHLYRQVGLVRLCDIRRSFPRAHA